MRFLYFTLTLCLFAMNSTTHGASIEVSPPSVPDFFGESESAVLGAELSPSGKHLAIQRINGDGRTALLVLDTATLKSVHTVASFNDADVSDMGWINDDRLYYRTSVRGGASWRANGAVFAVNRDGESRKQLRTASGGYEQETTGTTIKRRMLPWDYQIEGSFHDGSDDVLVSRLIVDRAVWEITAERLFRLNTKTLELRDLLDGKQPERISRWTLNAQNEVVAGEAWDKGRHRIHIREGQAWRTIGDFDAFSGEGFQPKFVIGKDLYVTASKGDLGAIYKLGREAGKPEGEAIIEIEGYDFNGYPIFDRRANRLLGFRHLSDAWGTTWTDPKMVSIQKSVDEYLPTTINHLACGNCSESPAYLISAVSDRQPVSFWLVGGANDKPRFLGASRPSIKPQQVGTRELHRFVARDGLSIPVYLTLPAGESKAPRPAVVLVHGGPWARGATWEWSDEAQFLASRGYVVIEPEFRGSTGFGFAHFKAGWKQWGLAMQDDLADAAKWAIASGVADPKRMAIAGASYGGYATLMGLAKNPELFRCGFEWVGVSDIRYLYQDRLSDISSDARNYDLKVLIGDPDRDADMLKSVSPVNFAAQIKQPLLMAYGREDSRVAIEHGNAMYAAIREHNPLADLVVYQDEGHGWAMSKTRIDFWARVEAFLKKNL
ncbi:prolyl oligopeptidase family serine peptidase [Niveibacterium sp. 24ML]|uniref:alpha/beta hydrolase family protein n=1 Tax=Niveibacterium sp. 24ML TaxID=2985512 RepID=UPI00227057FE|nr:prolyl oligopeptidase family serine peptidase [Niveibacterium sp. 24ML]MCX9157494.1 prolyl oligopeptidase family serine peptidase [Niveibacterium sp. 24ML]